MNRTIQQVTAVRESSGLRLVAKSAGVSWAREELLLILMAKLGTPPHGVTCPAALAVLPMDKLHTVIINYGGSPLHYHALIFEKRTYEVLNDPFAISERYSKPTTTTGELPTLEWPPENLPLRRVEDIMAILKNGDMPFLLGGVQALLDGASILLVRDAPANETLRSLWQLLPERARAEMTLATHLYNHDLHFDLAATPTAPEPWPEGTLTEEQVKDYPEGRYELALQVAAETGDQAELDRLFSRRSSKDTLKIATSLVIFAVVVAVLSKFLL